MSSWKKASKVNQKTHRERHQPESRAHLGLLEKKKDYKLRANDFNRKKAILKKLKLKAENKSPNEFYFHMINSKIIDGVHKEKKNLEKHTPEQIKLMESQDLSYIRFRKTMELKKVSRLQSELHLVDTANNIKNNHIFFVDSKEEAKGFNLAKQLDTHPALIPRRTNRIRNEDLQKNVLPSVDEEVLKKIYEERKKSYSTLQKRMEREKQLGIIQNKLEVKQQLKNRKGVKPKLVKKATKSSAPVYEWPSERKR